MPPAIAIAIEIIEALLAAEQGVTSFAVSFGQTGSFIQDVATARVLRKLTRDYLDEFGFDAMQRYLVYHQWMGQFPQQREKAAALIAGSALMAGMIGADKIVVKTVDEALGVPRAEVNAEAVDTVRYVLRAFALRDSRSTSPLIDREAALIESEVREHPAARSSSMPGDAFWESVFRAFQLGYLDVPFSPHADNANKLISMRDANGSIRIARPGARADLRTPTCRASGELLASRARPRRTRRTASMLADIYADGMSAVAWPTGATPPHSARASRWTSARRSSSSRGSTADDRIVDQQFLPARLRSRHRAPGRRRCWRTRRSIAIATPMLVCSSANGGLRVGIVCLSPAFQRRRAAQPGAAGGRQPGLRARPRRARRRRQPRVDILLVGGGIDCEDAAPMRAATAAASTRSAIASGRWSTLATAISRRVFASCFPTPTSSPIRSAKRCPVASAACSNPSAAPTSTTSSTRKA